MREHSTKRTDGIIHRPCTRTTTHRPAQHELALCDRCHTAWASEPHGWVPAGHRYTRADFGQEAVGGSTTTTRARKRHATRHTQCEQQVCCSPERDCGTRVVNTVTGGNLTAWVAEQAHPQHGSVRITATWQRSYVADNPQRGIGATMRESPEQTS